MSKPAARGITKQQIREAIAQLHADNEEPTTTKIRQQLGTGSFTTIGAVLAQWRNEQETAAKAQIPAIPSSVNSLTRRLWLEAWQAASEAHETERVGFRAERAAWDRSKAEMVAEIERLETGGQKLAETIKQHESDAQRQTEKLSDLEGNLAIAECRIESLEKELQRLREERIRFVEQVGALSERVLATAEARIAPAPEQ